MIRYYLKSTGGSQEEFWNSVMIKVKYKSRLAEFGIRMIKKNTFNWHVFVFVFNSKCYLRIISEIIAFWILMLFSFKGMRLLHGPSCWHWTPLNSKTQIISGHFSLNYLAQICLDFKGLKKPSKVPLWLKKLSPSVLEINDHLSGVIMQ